MVENDIIGNKQKNLAWNVKWSAVLLNCTLNGAIYIRQKERHVEIKNENIFYPSGIFSVSQN